MRSLRVLFLISFDFVDAIFVPSLNLFNILLAENARRLNKKHYYKYGKHDSVSHLRRNIRAAEYFDNAYKHTAATNALMPGIAPVCDESVG